MKVITGDGWQAPIAGASSRTPREKGEVGPGCGLEEKGRAVPGEAAGPGSVVAMGVGVSAVVGVREGIGVAVKAMFLGIVDDTGVSATTAARVGTVRGPGLADLRR